MNTNYTMKVFKIEKDETSSPGTLILELDGKLSRKAKREIEEQINRSRVIIRQNVKELA